VEMGLQESLRAGATTVGEIATYDQIGDKLTNASDDELTGSGAASGWPQVVAFRELLGLGPERVETLVELAQQHLRAETNAIAGLSPHAPYTVHPELLERVCKLSATGQFPIAMHLAESREELQLIGEQKGRLQQMLADVGAWPDGVFTPGTRPLHYLAQLQQAWRCLVVHGNYLDGEELDYLAANRGSLSLVYCPRTHHYFGHDHYPLADALARGVRVVLGTDSRASNPDLSLLNEMRFVVKEHDEVALQDVLEMATIRAAESLGLEDDRGSLQVGKRADLAILPIDNVSLDPLDVILKTECEPLGVFVNGCLTPLN